MLKKIFLFLLVLISFLFIKTKNVLAVAETSFENTEGFVLDASLNGQQGWSGSNDFYVRDTYLDYGSSTSFDYGWFIRSVNDPIASTISHSIASSSSSTQYFRMGIESELNTHCAIWFNSDAVGQFGILIDWNGYISLYEAGNTHNIRVMTPDLVDKLIYFAVNWNFTEDVINVQIGSSSYSYETGLSNTINGISFEGDASGDGACYWDEFSSFGSYTPDASPSVFEEYFGDKIPFVYFFQLEDIFDNLVSTTASSSYGLDALTMTIPASQMGADSDITLHLASLSYVYALMPSDKWDIFKDLLRGALYFTIVIYFYVRLRGLFHPMGTS